MKDHDVVERYAELVGDDLGQSGYVPLTVRRDAGEHRTVTVGGNSTEAASQPPAMYLSAAITLDGPMPHISK